MSDEAVEKSWTERFADDVNAALEGEHRPRWTNGKPCSDHRADDCCDVYCTTCSLFVALESSGLPTTEEGN